MADPFKSLFDPAPHVEDAPKAATVPAPAEQPGADTFGHIFNDPNAAATPSQPSNAITTRKYWEETAGNLAPSLGKLWDQLKEMDESGGKAYARAMHDPVGSFKDLRDSIAQIAPNLPGHLINLGATLADSMIKRYGKYDEKTGRPNFDFENAKKTLHDDPAGAAMDALSVVPSPATEAAVGKTLEGAGAAMKFTGKVVGKAVSTLSEGLHGTAPGTLEEAFMSGKEMTPERWKMLFSGMDKDEALKQINTAFEKLGEQRAENYDDIMQRVEGHSTPLKFDKIWDAVNNAGEIRTYTPKNQMGPFLGGKPRTAMIEQNLGIQDMRGKVLALVKQWEDYGPEFHTAFGLDKLKQSIYSLTKGMIDANGMPTAEAKYVRTITNAIGDAIKKEAPIYGTAMENWQNDSNLMEQFQREFKAGDPSRSIKALKSLQQIWRNTAGVAHGAKRELLEDVMDKTGNDKLLRQMALDQYSPIWPRGMRGVGYGLALPEIAYHAMHDPVGAAKMAALATAASPRLWGSGAVAAGEASRAIGPRAAAAKDFASQYATPAARAATLAERQDTEEPHTPHKRGGFFSQRRKK